MSGRPRLCERLQARIGLTQLGHHVIGAPSDERHAAGGIHPVQERLLRLGHPAGRRLDFHRQEPAVGELADDVSSTLCSHFVRPSPDSVVALDTGQHPVRPCGMHANDVSAAPPPTHHHQLELQEPEPHQVRAARLRAGHTQTQAGQLVGGSLRTWQDWEGGKRAMPAATLALYLLLTDQHPDMRLTRRKIVFGGLT